VRDLCPSHSENDSRSSSLRLLRKGFTYSPKFAARLSLVQERLCSHLYVRMYCNACMPAAGVTKGLSFLASKIYPMVTVLDCDSACSYYSNTNYYAFACSLLFHLKAWPSPASSRSLLSGQPHESPTSANFKTASTQRFCQPRRDARDSRRRRQRVRDGFRYEAGARDCAASRVGGLERAVERCRRAPVASRVCSVWRPGVAAAQCAHAGHGALESVRLLDDG